jgi:hypothetical protein
LFPVFLCHPQIRKEVIRTGEQAGSQLKKEADKCEGREERVGGEGLPHKPREQALQPCKTKARKLSY